MGAHRTFSDAAIEAALAATGRENLAAARMLGCAVSTVWNYRQRSGEGSKVASGRPWSLTPAQRERIAQFRESGKTFAAIAAEVGCSISATQWTCASLGAEHPTKRPPTPYRDPERISIRNGHPMRSFGPAEDAVVVELSLAGRTPHSIARTLKRAPSSVLGRMRTLARREEREFA